MSTIFGSYSIEIGIVCVCSRVCVIVCAAIAARYVYVCVRVYLFGHLPRIDDGDARDGKCAKVERAREAPLNTLLYNRDFHNHRSQNINRAYCGRCWGGDGGEVTIIVGGHFSELIIDCARHRGGGGGPADTRLLPICREERIFTTTTLAVRDVEKQVFAGGGWV